VWRHLILSELSCCYNSDVSSSYLLLSCNFLWVPLLSFWYGDCAEYHPRLLRSSLTTLATFLLAIFVSLLVPNSAILSPPSCPLCPTQESHYGFYRSTICSPFPSGLPLLLQVDFTFPQFPSVSASHRCHFIKYFYYLSPLLSV